MSCLPLVAEKAGSSTHLPVCGFLRMLPVVFHCSAGSLPLQAYILIGLPLVRFCCQLSRHLPLAFSMVPLLLMFHPWATVLLQVNRSTLVPFALPRCQSSRHLPAPP